MDKCTLSLSFPSLGEAAKNCGFLKIYQSKGIQQDGLLRVCPGNNAMKDLNNTRLRTRTRFLLSRIPDLFPPSFCSYLICGRGRENTTCQFLPVSIFRSLQAKDGLYTFKWLKSSKRRRIFYDIRKTYEFQILMFINEVL